MSRICLDASSYVEFRRGGADLVEVVRRATEVVVPWVVAGELRAAFRRSRHRERHEAELARFLAHPAVSTCEVDDDTAEHYARLADEQRRHGPPARSNDLWIAASAARHGLTLVTCDPDVGRIRGAAIEVVAPR